MVDQEVPTTKTRLLNRSNMSKEEWVEKAKSFPWDKRTIPSEYIPVQQDNGITASCIDWWSTRSPLFCCLFPFAKCYTGAKTVDGTDPSVWKKQLEANKNCPESMQGVWFLKDNHAHEELVTIFNDWETIGDINEDGTDGYGRWTRSLKTNWSRDNTCFGYILLMFSKYKGDPQVGGLYNLKDGIITLDPGTQWVFRVNDNEWWKIHHVGQIGEAGEKDINFMYQWLKVLDKDGEPTEHWEEYVKWSKDPLPHRNCCEPWFPFWPCCGFTNQQKFEDMTRPNVKQNIIFRE